VPNYTGTDNLEVMADATNYNDYLLSLISEHARKGSLIVDFGAGIGTFARRLAQAGYQVHCIEPDPAQAAQIVAAGLQVSASIDDLTDGTVDYLYTLNVLEHIEEEAPCLQQMRRKLKAGGTLLIYVPAFQVLFSSMDRKVGHFRRYTRTGLVNMLKAQEFQVIRARYADSIGFAAALVFRLFGNDSGALNRGALVFYDRFVFPVSRLCDFAFKYLFGKNVVVVAQTSGAVDG
jgi:SAM-dependent methyltransferase